MAFYDLVWYCNAGDQSTTGYYAVAKWATGATIAAGALRRQLAAPAVGSERMFVCIVAGTTHATTEPTWVITRGGKTTDNTVTWMECTGLAGLNGDSTNTQNWTAAKAIGTPTLGAIIKRNNGASYQICTTAGTMGASEPAFSDTAGVTTTETAGTAVWTSLGVVGNFTGGQAPHARLANVAHTAGNTIYVGDNHAESQATSLTIAPQLTVSTVTKIICHNHSGGYPPASTDLATGATISVTGIGMNLTFGATGATAGTVYVYGLTLIAGSGSGNAALTVGAPNANHYFDACVFKYNTTSNTAAIGLTSNGLISWNNCTVGFGLAGQYIDVGYTAFTWRNTGPVLSSGSLVPTNLLGQSVAGRVNTVMLEALDLNQVASIYIFNPLTSINSWVIKDCKLNASATFQAPVFPGQQVQFIRCDGAATAYKSARYAYEGTETTETSITRVGGASDPTGQAQSRKIVTTANTQWLRPFKAEPYAIWNPTTGANVTVTVYGTINAGALPNNDDIWIEVEYLGSASFPVGTIVTTTKANLYSANAAVASDGSTWNGGGSGAGWSPFKLTLTLSAPQPGMAGYLHARVRAAKASTTFYIDPKIALS